MSQYIEPNKKLKNGHRKRCPLTERLDALRFMKHLIAVAAILFSYIANAESLVTKNFTIEVQSQCSEGEVSCKKVEFLVRLVDNTSGEKVLGSTLHSVCDDGETPCAFQGYTFFLNGGQYILHASGVLQIVDEEGNPLLLELGQWH